MKHSRIVAQCTQYIFKSLTPVRRQLCTRTVLDKTRCACVVVLDVVAVGAVVVVDGSGVGGSCGKPETAAAALCPTPSTVWDESIRGEPDNSNRDDQGGFVHGWNVAYHS